MSDVEIKAKKKIGDEDKEATIYVDLGEDLEQAITKFGEAVVFSNFKASAKITAQAAMRRYLETKKSAEEIVKLMAAWKPGVAIERVSNPVAAFKAKFASMTPEEQIAALADLKKDVKTSGGAAPTQGPSTDGKAA